MPNDNPNLQMAMSKLVAYLQNISPGPALDEIAILIDGGVDDAGQRTPAMDRQIARREAAVTRRTPAEIEAFNQRFPHANRLTR